MGLLDLASDESFWRGYDYYREGKVKAYQQLDEYIYEGTVKGNKKSVYSVMINIRYPKSSTCNCSHAAGKRRVCKHKVALYFEIFPEEADRVLREAEEWEAIEAQRWQDECKEIERYVNSLSKKELREQLLRRLIDELERSRRH